MIFYLYVKTHNKTGLKYLGQTTRDPYIYKGSGTYWMAHLKEHGNDVSTELIAAFDNKDDLKVAGQYWSQYWNVVQSHEWANLIEEVGDGVHQGHIPWNKGKKGIQEGWNKGLTYTTHPWSEENKQKIRKPKSIPSRLKGRTYEDIYGYEKAQQLCADRSQKLMGNRNNLSGH